MVLEGRATIEWDGGRIEVGPGDVCALEPGTETVWTVHETLLKGFRIDAGRHRSRDWRITLDYSAKCASRLAAGAALNRGASRSSRRRRSPSRPAARG